MSWCNLVSFTYGFYKKKYAPESKAMDSKKTSDPIDTIQSTKINKCKTCDKVKQKHYETIYFCAICKKYVCDDCYKKGRFLLPVKGSIYSCKDQDE